MLFRVKQATNIPSVQRASFSFCLGISEDEKLRPVHPNLCQSIVLSPQTEEASSPVTFFTKDAFRKECDILSLYATRVFWASEKVDQEAKCKEWP